MSIVHHSFKSVVFLTAFGLVAFVSAIAVATVPVTMTQQGRLIDADSEPRTGEIELLFEIHDTPNADGLLWSDELTVDVGDNGVYNVVLGGSDNPIDAEVLQGGRAYLGLTVEGSELSPRLEMTSVPFATLAGRATVAESVVDGSVTADSLAPGAVTTEAIETIDWSQITGVPLEINEPTDTLAELSCGPDNLALFDGTGWGCAALPTYSGQDFALSNQGCGPEQMAVGIAVDGTLMCDTEPTYTAGSGIELDDGRFSVVDGQFLECWASPCPVGQSSRVYLDGSSGGDNYLGVQSTNPWGGTQVVSGNDTRVEGSLRVDEDANFINRVTVNSHLFPRSTLHVRQDNTQHGLALTKVTSQNTWTLGTNGNTNNLDFRYTDNISGSPLERRAWIDHETGGYNISSDRRVKRDIEPLQGLLDDVLALQPKQYRYDHAPDGEPTMGFVAQDVDELFPHLVSYDADSDYYGLSYAGFGVLAVQALQEQQQIIDDLEERLADLEDRLAEAGI